jgi:hypothetical protein
MAWKCPACSTVIRHAALEEAPSAGALYRCHLCRLDLTRDPKTGQLVVVPRQQDPPGKRSA